MSVPSVQLPELGAIAGLHWKENWRVANGGPSYVVPFPRTRPTTIVYHGNEPFSYGHYGIHLGQQDRLTFLGRPDQIITARFLDCRKGSPTARKQLEVKFSPSSRWELNIPPGVGHTFSGLENIVTLNNYDLFLPEPEDWLSGNTDWDIDTDILNVAEDFDPANLKLFRENAQPASDVFYRIVADKQKAGIPLVDTSYPYTHEHKTDSGTTYLLKIREKSERSNVAQWQPIEDIPGLGWSSNPVMESGPKSGFVPLTACRPYYVVDHGFSDEYTHDAYGIHLGQQDRLIFLGPETCSAHVEFVDCRINSPVVHKKVRVAFAPDATKTLVIPPGVAHRFEHLEGVFTLNHGDIFLSETKEYEPGNDVIDWPISNATFPVLEPNHLPAPESYYRLLASSQEALRLTKSHTSTPVVFLAKDDSGNEVRIAMRN